MLDFLLLLLILHNHVMRLIIQNFVFWFQVKKTLPRACFILIKRKSFLHKDDTNLQHFFLNYSEEIQRYQLMNFHWNILSTNLKHCCLLAHEFSLKHCLNKLEILLSYKDETNLQHFARVALKKNFFFNGILAKCPKFVSSRTTMFQVC